MLPIFETIPGRNITYLESPDTLLDENFEEAFNDTMNDTGSLKDGHDYDDDDEVAQEDEVDDFADVAKHEIVEIVGDDRYGRKVITIYACRLPANNKDKTFHSRLLK